MKKMIQLGSLAALALVAGCSKEDGKATSEFAKGTPITITASVGDGSTAKATVDAQWKVRWEAGDELALISVNGATQTVDKFTQAGALSNDGKKTAFTGTPTGSGSRCFVYPYTASGMMDLSAQEYDCSNPTANLGKYSYMKSTSVDESTLDFTLQHCTTPTVLKLYLTNVGALTDVRITKVVAKLKSGYTSGSTFAPKLNLDGTAAENGSPTTITVKDCPALESYVSTDKTYPITMMAFPVTVAKNDALEVEVTTNWGRVTCTKTAAEVQSFTAGTVGSITLAMDMATVTPWAGAGTEADPYRIYNKADLELLSRLVNVGNPYSGKHFKLMSSLDLEGIASDGTGVADKTWTPIGEYSKPFSGTFNGDSKTISGLYASNTVCQGLFGCITDGTVKNLTVAGLIEGNGGYYGGICGRAVGASTIEDCHFSGNISGGGDSGGICGSMETTANGSGSIVRCTNSGTIKGRTRLGGILGNAYDPDKKNSASITGCTNSGNVESTSPHAGGISGANGIITGCINTGSVKGTYYVGGIVGGMEYDIACIKVLNCYNGGNVTATDASGAVGGLVGDHANGEVKNSYSTGTVTGSTFVGGVCGFVEATAKTQNAQFNCYYLTGSAKDGNGTVQFGVGNRTAGLTTTDIAGKTTEKTLEEMKQPAFLTLLNAGVSPAAWTQVAGELPMPVQ